MGICLIVKSGGGIDTSNANATAGTIVSGYTCYVNDVLITGTMPKQSLSKELGPSGSQTISAGYYDGNSSKISVSTLSSVTGGTSVATSDVLTGYTYWANGSKYTGTMTNRGTKTWTIGINGSQTIESGWHNGSGTVKQSLSTDNSECWRTPSTSQQQLCWSGYYYSKNRGCYGNSNLTAGNIKKGISIFGVAGSYYETKRYLIQNGTYTSSLISLYAYTGGLPSNTTTTYNNATWKLVADYDYDWIDKDEGGWTRWWRYTVISSIASLCTITSNTSIGCKVHGDILCYGWSSSGAVSKTYKWTIQFGLGNTSRAAESDATVSAAAPWAGSIPSFSNGLKYARAHGSTPNTSLVIDASMSYSGNSYQHSVYAKNLWLETSESVSWS